MWSMTIYRDDSGACRWSLVASNGRKFACSGESFARPSGARKAANRMLEMLGADVKVTVVDRTAAAIAGSRAADALGALLVAAVWIVGMRLVTAARRMACSNQASSGLPGVALRMRRAMGAPAFQKP